MTSRRFIVDVDSREERATIQPVRGNRHASRGAAQSLAVRGALGDIDDEPEGGSAQMSKPLSRPRRLAIDRATHQRAKGAWKGAGAGTGVAAPSPAVRGEEPTGISESRG